MTKKQFISKLKELTKDLKELVEEEAVRLFESGAIDTKAHDNDYALPKIVLSAVLKREAWQYSPLDGEGKKYLENLMHF
jgi:hypothetical protein